jgi:hypothetical protein
MAPTGALGLSKDEPIQNTRPRPTRHIRAPATVCPASVCTAAYTGCPGEGPRQTIPEKPR